MMQSRMAPFYIVLLAIFVLGVGVLALKSGVPSNPVMPGAVTSTPPVIPTREWRVAGQKNKKDVPAQAPAQSPSVDSPEGTVPNTAAPSPAPSETGSQGTVPADGTGNEATAPAGGDGWN